MDKNFFISTILRGTKHEIRTNDVDALDIVNTSDHKYHVISANKTYQIELLEACYETKTFTIRLNGKKIKLKLEDEFDLNIKKMGFSNSKSKDIKELIAPMPGMVLDILKKENDAVKEGDPLIILEAMKMENLITSPVDGVIDKLEIKLNQAVNKNQILLNFK